VANGCLLFKESCNTERNNCWQLVYKLEETETVVTQTVKMETSATKEEAAAAVQKAVEAKTGPVVTATAKAGRRLVGEGRNLQAMNVWDVTWIFKTFNEAAGKSAYEWAEKTASDKGAEALFIASIKKEAFPAVVHVTDISEPVKESGGTTMTPDVQTTM